MKTMAGGAWGGMAWLARVVALAMVLVFGACSSDSDPPARPPEITVQPQSVSVPDGSSATFTVAATGDPLPTYQWRRNGSAIAGATAASYTTPPNALADSGARFDVAVSNSAGSVTSTAATLTVAPVAPRVTLQPADTSVVDGATATFSVAADGSAPIGYQWLRNGTPVAGATAASLSLAATLADNGDAFSVVLTNAAGSVTSAAAVLGVTAAVEPPAIDTPPQSLAVNVGQAATFTVVARGTAPLRYQWFRNGAAIDGATGTGFTTAVTSLADNGTRFSVRVSNGAGTAAAAEATLTVLPAAPVIKRQPADTTVVAGSTATFSVDATGTAPLAYQWRRGGVALAGATASSYTTPATLPGDDGALFSVEVSNGGGTVSSAVARLGVSAALVPPSITGQPQAQTVTAGQAATFSVVAAGSPPLSYQWQRGGSAIAGATDASYTTPATAAGDSGALFRVLVSNATGTTVTSNAVALTVQSVGPTITAQPRSTTVLVGRPAAFSVTAVGSAPLSYQWRRNGVDIAGERGSTLSLARTTFADHGASFAVVVRDATNVAVVSDSVMLGVTPIEVLTISPSNYGAVTRNADGSVWGIGGYPGNPSSFLSNTPVLHRDANGFVVTGYASVQAGLQHVVALKSDGTVAAFGAGQYGMLGNGATGGIYSAPVAVTMADGTPLTGAAAIGAGYNTSFAVMADGSVKAWGLANYLGAGALTANAGHPVPVIVADGSPLTGVVALTTGNAAKHTLALRSDGSLWVWGYKDCEFNVVKCLSGDGVTVNSRFAVPVLKADRSPMTNPRSMATGTDHTAVVQSDGTVLSWGMNSAGQIGDNTTIERDLATTMLNASGGVFDNVVQVAAGAQFTVLLRADGTVWAVGNNASGAIGDGTNLNRKTPVQVIDDTGAPLTGVVAITAGRVMAFAKKADGSFWGWGDNSKCGITDCVASAGIVRTARRQPGFAP